MAAWGLFASALSFADTLDARLVGAWATSEADCKKLFVRSARGIAYRQPVDKFAQAAIIGPDQIRAPASVCRVQRVSHANGVIKLSAECNNSVSYTRSRPPRSKSSRAEKSFTVPPAIQPSTPL